MKFIEKIIEKISKNKTSKTKKFGNEFANSNLILRNAIIMILVVCSLSISGCNFDSFKGKASSSETKTNSQETEADETNDEDSKESEALKKADKKKETVEKILKKNGKIYKKFAKWLYDKYPTKTVKLSKKKTIKLKSPKWRKIYGK
nr:hypothetical protein [Lachnospiraceae bacterium]